MSLNVNVCLKWKCNEIKHIYNCLLCGADADFRLSSSQVQVNFRLRSGSVQAEFR